MKFPNKHDWPADSFSQDLRNLISVLKSTSDNIHDVADVTSTCSQSGRGSKRCNCTKVHGVLTLTWRRMCHLSRMSGICNGMTVWTHGSFGDLFSLTTLCFCILFALIQNAQWFPYIPKALKDAAGNLPQGCELSWMAR
jgi:hypothetical protein